MTEDNQTTHKSRLKLFLTIATFIAMGILIYALRHEIKDVIRNLGRVNAVVLLVIIPLEALNCDAYARLYRSFFAILGNKINYWFLYRLNLELNFVNHILPSGGVSGISYFGVRMRSVNISGAKATLMQFMKFMLLFVSFQPLLILGLIFLAARGHANNLVIAVASSLITLLIVGTVVSIYILESRSRINSSLTFVTRGINRLIHIFRRSRPETINIKAAQAAFDELHSNYQIVKKQWRKLKSPFIYTLIANITEIAALYSIYVAFGQRVNVGAVILAYAVANFAGLISVLPAGIGIYEGLMTAVLAATGIPVAISIPVTVMYRVLTMFVQLLPGYILYQRALKKGLSSQTSA